MSPISPFVTGGGQNDWLDVQIPNYNEKCPVCGSNLISVFTGIGGFPGHEFIHPGPLCGYECPTCHCRFSLEELAKLKEEKARKEARAGNYWEDIRASFKSPYLYLFVACLLQLYESFWIGIAAGVITLFLVPLLVSRLKIVFAPVGRLVRKILPPDKPPDSPKTP